MGSQALPAEADVHMIISDVDGTLLDSDHRLHPRTFHALQWLRKNRPSLPIVIATGKQRTSVIEIREPLNLDVFRASHLNGCVVYNPGGVVASEVGLDKDTLIQLYRQFSAAGISTFFYDREKVYEVQGTDGPIWGDKLRGYGESVVSVDESFVQQIQDGSVTIIKAAICQKAGPELEQSRGWLTQQYAHNAFTMVQALPFCIELIPTTGSKGIALAKILDLHEPKIQAKNVLSFGDGQNDVSMFEIAGYAVAMANAMPAAVEASTHRTLSNDEGGVGVFLEQLYGFTYEEKPYDYWL
ncbi:HAD-like domain-containing protein [Protomyces lactucae-debilis]|uniref:HAD-like domain-containing protein n=1 Tax=Protomyces lactucae-debilis TaxID=2754530 RepID=A0A1Y2FIB6_PROLT|nr:HAD-like domain-containing protein [Protomyces lactucae-debilis]ORY83691.1 HAD-like domain-containing protein [Protomyces lactucae-debilis]